jgi:hypothetical protein
MTEKETKKILDGYREADEDTGESYGYKILEGLGRDGDGFVFRCKADGVDDTCVMGVYPGGTVLCVPQ